MFSEGFLESALKLASARPVEKQVHLNIISFARTRAPELLKGLCQLMYFYARDQPAEPSVATSRRFTVTACANHPGAYLTVPNNRGGGAHDRIRCLRATNGTSLKQNP